jgi:hypothetical protein
VQPYFFAGQVAMQNRHCHSGLRFAVQGSLKAGLQRLLWLALIAALSPLGGCAATYSAMEAGRVAQQQGDPAVTIIGEGKYAYRFTLIDPGTNQPSPNKPYGLTTGRNNPYHLPFVADEKNVYQGVSDADGKTAIFRLPVRISDGEWDLRERFGSGPFGETFRVTNAESGKPLANFPYLLMICTTPPQYFRGLTYPNGDTAYSASAKPETIELLYEGDFNDEDLPKSCNEADEVATEPKPADPIVPPPIAPDAAVVAATATASFERPTLATIHQLQELIAQSEAAMTLNEFAAASGLLSQVKATIAANEAQFDNFDGYAIRANFDLLMTKAIEGGRSGDPCLSLRRSRVFAAKADAEPYTNRDMISKTDVGMISAQIATEFERFDC